VDLAISALLEMPRSTVSAVIVKWKCLGAVTAQLRSDRPNKLTEQDHRVLKRVKIVSPGLQTLTPKFQTELYEIGFHGKAAAQKPKITMHNANCRLEWCKAYRHWTLEQCSLE
jgi:hypothetical protein